MRLHFRHNIYAHQDSKLEKLVDAHGPAGLGYWWTLVEMYCAKLSEDDKKNPYQRIAPRSLCRRVRSRIDNTQKVMDTMIEIGLILVSESDSSLGVNCSLNVSSVSLFGSKASANCFVWIPNILKYFGSYKRKENTFRHIKLNEIKEKNKIKKDSLKSDQSTALANRIIESLSAFSNSKTDFQSRRDFLGDDGLEVCSQLGGWTSLAFSSADRLDFIHSKIRKACKDFIKTRGADREDN